MTRKSPIYQTVSKVLIYRLGSIGDTMVALPAFRLVAQTFPGAERRLLTNHSDGGKAAPMDMILGPMNLVHGYIKYPLKTRDPLTLCRLASQIRQWGPQTLIYIAQPRGRFKILRDAIFFRACGIRSLIGIPWVHDQQQCRKLDQAGFRESEAARLLRCLKSLGNGIAIDTLSMDLSLRDAELREARRILNRWPAREAFVCASIGTKSWIKDWGSDNWNSLFETSSAKHPGVGLIMVGTLDEYDLSQKVAGAWLGPTLNLCGNLTAREAAAVINAAILFVGHDSGPMHLAASVGKPCVAIFGAQNMPGEWYPFGAHHRVLYHQTPCFGCRLKVRCDYDKKCIRSITIEEVDMAMEEVWARQTKAG